MTGTRYDKISDNGNYGLKGHTLFRIVPKGEDMDDYEVGTVYDTENFETAVDNAEEEMRIMIADAREEFGF